MNPKALLKIADAALTLSTNVARLRAYFRGSSNAT